MASKSTTRKRSRCLNCGFEAPDGDEEWIQIEVPKLGRMTQCPNCDSTNVITGQSIA
ncbi:anaerobic ribonucleoside-triphosphate reductase [Natronobeatus ordinarius]|uniref:anaerobic ribonucleoside-triphosphate reductase n=1 Tax=Natronobeatus ordinarius TaxID=2963433 RepID=UPI0020CDB884|nr:anaerobic ribonucleoside-triphosphate reductase [Natronobeatus ordinarius]